MSWTSRSAASTSIATHHTTARTPTPAAAPSAPVAADAKRRLRRRRYAFVHVGKTAGSAVGCRMGERRLCRGARRVGALGTAAACRLHMWSPGPRAACHAARFDAWLFTLRHPVDRLVSWFHYERPGDPDGDCRPPRKAGAACPCRLAGCFRDADAFARAAAPSAGRGPWPPPGPCRPLAFDVARGQRSCRAHNAFNYEYYVHLANTFRGGSAAYPVLALRQEHLGEDWDGLEAGFGGGRGNGNETTTGADLFRARLNPTFPRGAGAGGRPRDALSSLSDAGKAGLCAALCREMQVYKYLLFRAENLSAAQVRQSVRELRETCPEESAIIRDCPADMDDLRWWDLFDNSTFDIKQYLGVPIVV